MLRMMSHTHYATYDESYPLCYVWWVIPTMSRMMSHTHYATYDESYPLCYVWWVIPTMLRMMSHTHYATYDESYPLCYVWWVIPTMLRMMSHTHYATYDESYPLCHVWWVIPTKLRSMSHLVCLMSVELNEQFYDGILYNVLTITGCRSFCVTFIMCLSSVQLDRQRAILYLRTCRLKFYAISIDRQAWKWI